MNRNLYRIPLVLLTLPLPIKSAHAVTVAKIENADEATVANSILAQVDVISATGVAQQIDNIINTNDNVTRELIPSIRNLSIKSGDNQKPLDE